MNKFDLFVSLIKFCTLYRIYIYIYRYIYILWGGDTKFYQTYRPNVFKNKTAGEKARRQLHKNAESNIEQVLEATPHKATTIPATYLPS